VVANVAEPLQPNDPLRVRRAASGDDADDRVALADPREQLARAPRHRDLLRAVDDRGEGPVEVEERSGSRRVDREWCRDAEDLARAREGGGHRAL